MKPNCAQLGTSTRWEASVENSSAQNSDSIAVKSFDWLDAIQASLQLLGFCDSAGLFEGVDGFVRAGGGGGRVERRDEGHPEQAGAGVVVVMHGQKSATDDEVGAGTLPSVEVTHTLHPEGRFGCADGFRMQQSKSPELSLCQLLESSPRASF